jgi:hypothetical protein
MLKVERDGINLYRTGDGPELYLTRNVIPLGLNIMKSELYVVYIC